MILAESGEDKIRLVISSTLPSSVEYMTLSHCWGPKAPSRLTRANIESMKTGIFVGDLPRSFQHAIVVTGWFHCRYLWIDSLCIIQDSTEDWQNESSLMRHVYKNAWLNISATAAADSSSGLFFDRKPSLVSAGAVFISWEGNLPTGMFYFFLRDFWEDGVGRAPLNRRAWVVQERFLSRRNLHFGSRGIYFECHVMEACETFPKGLPTFFKEALINRFKAIDVPPVPTATAGAKSFLRNWQKITNAYTNSSLTYASDKLVALSGVADEFQNMSNYTYLAGLWKECFLANQLLWRTRKRVSGQPSVRPSIYRAPSWSWLSLDANIPGSVIIGPSVLIEILDAHTTLVDDNSPTGQVKHGVIRVRGQLEKVYLQKVPRTRDSYSICEEDDKKTGLLTVAFDETAFRATQAYIMPVMFSRGDTLEGLLLVSTEQAPAEFRRVGFFESDDEETHEQLTKQDTENKIIFTIV